MEANFSKVVHTPYGFTIAEIEQIKRAQSAHGIEAGWQKCLELGLRRISSSPRSNYRQNIRRKISTFVDVYIVGPSQLRNRIAHGQWHDALNTNNTALNHNLTQKLQDLNVVEVTKWFGVTERLLNIIEALIESPNRAFHRDYWSEISNLEAYIDETASWSLAEKVKQLQAKKPQRSLFSS